MKKLISILLAVIMVACAFAACGEKTDPTDAPKDPAKSDSSNPADTLSITPSSDKYRSYYQIWIGSFHDADDDEIGDIPGIIEKLDYINDGDPNSGDDLGMDGIWLSPMMPSSTYHKYNIEDYYDIDPDFGTLEDFDKLIEECHKRGVVVIIDLVLNHSGAGHEFFKKACEELKEGKTDGYARYYNFSTKQDDTYKYRVSGSDYYYQGDFWDQMPDWNLSFEGTREYFEDVTKFWFDHGVDGFRLDAVKYFTDGHTDGKEFLKWFYDMAKSYKEDVYMVGEDWDDAGNVYDMYESGIDSLFNFKFAGSGGEYVIASNGMVEDFAKQIKKYDTNIKKRNADAINANFLTNHDMVRVANMLTEDNNKMAAALYMLSPGNSFTYYGEEIGMEAENTNSDSYYRSAMIWDNDDLPEIYSNGIFRVVENELGGVKQQLAQDDSLLNTYRRLVRMRMQNPEIARGSITEVISTDDIKCAGYIVDCNGSRVLVVHNAKSEAAEISIDMLADPELRGWSNAYEAADAKLDGTTLTIPAKTSVVIKENK